MHSGKQLMQLCSCLVMDRWSSYWTLSWHPVWLHIFSFVRHVSHWQLKHACFWCPYTFLTIFYPVFPLWCVLSTEPAPCLFIPSLKVCTARSTRPFVLGCEGAEVMCLTPFFCKNDLNSLLTKLDPLSDTIISGKPSEDLILSMVTLEVEEFTQWISIHLQ